MVIQPIQPEIYTVTFGAPSTSTDADPEFTDGVPTNTKTNDRQINHRMGAGYHLRIYDISVHNFGTTTGTDVSTDYDVTIRVDSDPIPSNPFDGVFIDQKSNKTVTLTSPILVDYSQNLFIQLTNNDSVNKARVKVTLTGEVVSGVKPVTTK